MSTFLHCGSKVDFRIEFKVEFLHCALIEKGGREGRGIVHTPVSKIFFLHIEGLVYKYIHLYK